LLLLLIPPKQAIWRNDGVDTRKIAQQGGQRNPIKIKNKEK